MIADGQTTKSWCTLYLNTENDYRLINLKTIVAHWFLWAGMVVGPYYKV